MNSQRSAGLAAIAAGAMVLVALGTSGIVELRTRAAVEEAGARVAHSESLIRADGGRRDVLFGETVEGDAFAFYREAMRRAAELTIEFGDDDLVTLLHRPDELPPARRAELLEAWRPAVDLVRTGAHCSTAVPHVPGYDEVEVASLLGGRWLCNIACIEARTALAAGRGQDAVEWTLDAAMFGADLRHSTVLIDQMIGTALVAIASTEFWSDERLRVLGDDTLTSLDAGLAALDERTPVTMLLRGEHVFVATHLDRATGELAYGPMSTWRYGFSWRWMAADAIVEWAEALDHLDETADAPWRERRAALERQADQLAESDNELVRTLSHSTSAERSVRHVEARLRLLRAAVAVHRGDRRPSLPDPFGDGPLGVVEDGAIVQLTSRGDGEAIRRSVQP